MSAPCEPRATAPASAPPPPVPPVPPVASATASAPAARRPALDWRIRFAGLSLIWGFSFLLIKVGTEGYAPFQVTFGRLLSGTAVLVAAMMLRRERLPRSARTWGHLTVAALLLNALPFSLFSYAELTIPSTLAGICNATSPLGTLRSSGRHVRCSGADVRYRGGLDVGVAVLGGEVDVLGGR
ncbi:DMT family transporter, partial [Streptomyces parvus]|uniref:DMT family transporter n=1 Tax=Streptomyces parvus TaxID=66428 RepID=UPI0035E2738A